MNHDSSLEIPARTRCPLAPLVLNQRVKAKDFKKTRSATWDLVTPPSLVKVLPFLPE